jgi:hypothetical protein
VDPRKAIVVATRVGIPGLAHDLDVLLRHRPRSIPHGESHRPHLVVKAKGKKQKRKLRRKGKVGLKTKITYTPTGGDPSTQSKKLKLKLKRKKR